MKKILIGVVGLPPLPHRFNNTMSMSELIDYSVEEARLLAKGGVDSIIVQNLHDLPPGVDEQIETAAYMSVLTREIKRVTNGISLGVNVQTADPRANLAIAAACECDYVRIKNYVGAVVATDGIDNGCCSQAISYRHKINADQVKIYADVFDRMSSKLGEKDLGFMVSQALGYGKADAVIITGSNINESIEMGKIAKSKAEKKPVLLGGGANLEDMEKWARVFDGAIVGIAFREDGYSSKYDPEKIKAFIKEYRKY